MVRNRLVVALGLALLVACGAFSSDGDDAPDVTASPDAASPEAAGPAVPPGADAGDGGTAYVRTGVACRADTLFCNVGESCCNDGKGATFCAANCAAADAGFIVLECGRASDCPRGFECCASSNGGCGYGYLSGTQCVPAGTCKTCNDGGVGRLACDRKDLEGCPAGKTCSVTYEQTFYRACGD